MEKMHNTYWLAISIFDINSNHKFLGMWELILLDKEICKYICNHAPNSHVNWVAGSTCWVGRSNCKINHLGMAH